MGVTETDDSTQDTPATTPEGMDIDCSGREVKEDNGTYKVFDESGNAVITIESADSQPNLSVDKKFTLYTTECAGNISGDMMHSNYGFASTLHDMFILDPNGNVVFSQPFTYVAGIGDGIAVYACYNPDTLHTETGFSYQAVKTPVSTMLIDLTTMEVREISETASMNINNVGEYQIFGSWVVGHGATPTGDELFYLVNLETGERKAMAAYLYEEIYDVTYAFQTGYNGITYALFTNRGCVFLDKDFNDAFTGFDFPEEYQKYMNNGSEGSEFTNLPRFFPILGIDAAEGDNIQIIREGSTDWETINVNDLAGM